MLYLINMTLQSVRQVLGERFISSRSRQLVFLCLSVRPYTLASYVLGAAVLLLTNSGVDI